LGFVAIQRGIREHGTRFREDLKRVTDSGDPSTTQTRRNFSEATDPRLQGVFVSYASQDAGVANTIVAALERAGLRCWIAPRDVPPGGLYADAIIRAINGSRAMVLVLSEHGVGSSHVGKEIERASSKQRPIIALRTDATPLTPALEYFLSESQWIDVTPRGIDDACVRLIDAIQTLGASPSGARSAHDTPIAPRPVTRTPNRSALALIAIAVIALGYIMVDKLWLSRHGTGARTVVGSVSFTPAESASGSAAPPHSVAVLPFVNMSGDPKQDYFSDGLSEELLNSLAAIPDLQVAARTSSFSFKGRDVNVADIGRKLNVGAVLEGSVRKDGNEVRITAQLINALTGFHLWSHTYDRDLKNVLALQTEIATAVTQALQATLMANAAASIEIGSTKNPAAFDAYLRGKNHGREAFTAEHLQAQIDAYSEAVRLDPQFAKAYVGLANAQNSYANNFANGTDVRNWFKQSRVNAEKAVALAPDLGEAHSCIAGVMQRGYLEYVRALSEYEHAVALAPNDAGVLMRSGDFFVAIGRTETGLANIRRAIELDQLNPEGYSRLAIGLSYAGRYRESNEAIDRALQFLPNDGRLMNFRGINELVVGDLQAAQKDCDTPKREWEGRLCMSILYDKLHRHPDAEAELAKMQSELGTSASYQYAEIYTQWGNIPKALDWLDSAYRLPDPGITSMRSDPFIDPLRKEPRFQEIEHKLNVPN
jgi:TolB-like protein